MVVMLLLTWLSSDLPLQLMGVKATFKDERPLDDGETVVRFFGMKDNDSTLNVAMHTTKCIDYCHEKSHDLRAKLLSLSSTH